MCNQIQPFVTSSWDLEIALWIYIVSERHVSPSGLPCPAANLEINPLLFQTLGKWYAANADEPAALTNVFSLLAFTELEDRKDILSWKDVCFLDMSAFMIECPLNMKSCPIFRPINSQFLCISKSNQLLFPFRDLKKENGQCPNMFSSHLTEGQGRILSDPVIPQIILVYPSFLYFFHIVSVC